MDLLAVRVLLVVALCATGFFLRPFDLPQPLGCLIGAAAGLLIVLFELRIRRTSLKHLIGAGIGGLLGILAAYLIALVLDRSAAGQHANTISFLELAILAFLTYCGLVVGASKGDLLNLTAFGGVFGGEPASKHSFKILDTSVIIDGRIADLVETGFIDGTLVIPQFVLHELQLVADSSDSMRRNRGRRGLDILQRIQKMPHVTTQIVEEDFPNVREVDMKLIELAKIYKCKVMTNDFNLNKVAQLHGVEVLNINGLTNALRPVVLPGEVMRVFILKEGKEHNQGVAYLDDGTMVVVDNARKMISKTIDVVVTSVLQTTAGKMIFGRFDDRVHSVYNGATQTTPSGQERERTPREAAPVPGV